VIRKGEIRFSLGKDAKSFPEIVLNQTDNADI